MLDIVPDALLPPACPSTDQVTGRSEGSVGVATNCWVPFAATRAAEGLIERPDGTVTWADALLVGSSLLVAVIVWFPDVVGAVYRPFPSIVPTEAFPPATPSTVQTTPRFGIGVTVAVNCWVDLAATVADVGEILTLKPCVTVT